MFLRKGFQVEDASVTGYVIYADTKGGGYAHADAPGEGITCVDDTARAGIYFLRRYEEYLQQAPSKAERYKQLALETIAFCEPFRTKEGDYYNFVFQDGSINKQGITSRPSRNWWALRALWLLSEAVNLFSEGEGFSPEDVYQQAKATASLFKSELNDEGLIRGYTDMSSLYLITVANLYRYSNDGQWKTLLDTIADGLLKKQQDVIFTGIIDEGREEFSFHSWGSRQVQALSLAYQITQKEEYYQAACRMADSFYAHMMNIGPVYAFDRHDIELYPQIAYGTEAAVTSLYYLYSIKEEEKYAHMMALLNGFFYGNNHLKRPMIGPEGEGYDGLEKIFINRNAGAESTISYLLCASLIDRIPKRYHAFSLIKPIRKSIPKLLKAENMNAGLSDVENRIESGISGIAGTSFRLKDKVTLSPGKYLVYLLGMRLQSGNIGVYLADDNTSVEDVQSESPLLIGLVKRETNTNNTETSVMLSVKFENEAFINQLLFLPTIEYQVYRDSKTKKQMLWAYNTTNNTEKLRIYGVDLEVDPFSFSFAEIEDPLEETEAELEKDVSLNPEIIMNEAFNVGMLDLGPFYNNNGMGTDKEPGNFDNYGGRTGAYYPEVAINKLFDESVFMHEGIPFLMTRENKEDNIVTNGQTFQIEEQGNSLYILGSCDHGSYSGELEIAYEEGTKIHKDYVQLSFPDWCDSAVSEEKVALALNYRYNSQDLKEWINPKIYIQKIPLKEAKIKTIQLPVIPTMHLFAISIAK